MDEKTEELRDIFVDVAGEGTVTESQEETPGSLATDEERVDERIAAVIDRLSDRFAFDVDLDRSALVAVVRRFYDGDDDETVAAALDVSPDDVFRARMALHLFRDDDADAPFDLTALRDRPDADPETLATDLDVSVEQVRRYRRVLDARTEARQVSQRFRSEFEDALADAGLSTMTESMREDGLTEATEDIDSLEDDADVSF